MSIQEKSGKRASVGRRRAFMVAAILPAMAAIGVATAAAASAACPSGAFCLYEHINYGGAQGNLYGSNTNFANIGKSTGGTWNDATTAVRNNGTSGLGVNIYRNADYSGGSMCVPRGVSVPSLVSYGFNDVVSSNYWTSTCHS